MPSWVMVCGLRAMDSSKVRSKNALALADSAAITAGSAASAGRAASQPAAHAVRIRVRFVMEILCLRWDRPRRKTGHPGLVRGYSPS